jgi:integrase
VSRDREALRAHRLRQKEERLRAGPAWAETGLVFTTTIGTPLDARNLVRHFHETLQRAGLPRKRFHDLRHTAASLLLAMGTDLRVVQEVLGHSQITLTADTYAHVLPALLETALGKMEALFGGT